MVPTLGKGAAGWLSRSASSACAAIKVAEGLSTDGPPLEHRSSIRPCRGLRWGSVSRNVAELTDPPRIARRWPSSSRRRPRR